jgi:integrase
MDNSKFLTDEERIRLETMLFDRIETDTRNAVMFLTMLNTGCRPQELLNLEWDNINTIQGTVFINTLKKGKPRTIPISKKVRDALERLKSKCPTKPFDISSQRLCELWHLYRPNHAKVLHSLRHTFAIDTLKKVGNLKVVQQTLGHKSITNTMVYLDFDYSTKELKKLMKVR